MQNEPQPAPTTHNAQPPISAHPATFAPSDGERTNLPSIGPANEGQQLSTINEQLSPTIIEAMPVGAAVQHHKARRKGRIANLPKLQRDMVNHMLSNGLPYKQIVAALHNAGFNVLERNISTWATGGYLEWRLEQDFVLQNRLDQDQLVDHLRREDASELPEVGLQAAATRLSQVLLQKIARADNVEANLGSFSQMVDILCRLNRELGTLQKQRDESRRSLGKAHDPVRIKEREQMDAIENERDFSDPEDPDCGLAASADPPLLPAIPTTTTLELEDMEDAIRKQRTQNDLFLQMMKGFSRKKDTPSTAPAPLPPPQPPV